MAHPHFPWPMYEPLHRYDQEWMVPGLGLIERPDMATLLETNNRFIEAYLVGLNHEMGRELLWREYPTDQRGTYFDSFWTGEPELVADLHEPPWRTGELGAHVDQALDGRLVFLVRGDLVRRYPGVVAHAAPRGGPRTRGIPIFEAASPIETLFHVFLPPNVLLVGFDMTRARIDTPGETWWFTLSENPTEPRFGLDPSPRGRPHARQPDLGRLRGHPARRVPGRDPATCRGQRSRPRTRWGTSSAQVAYAAVPAARPGPRSWARGWWQGRCSHGRPRARPPQRTSSWPRPTAAADRAYAELDLRLRADRGDCSPRPGRPATRTQPRWRASRSQALLTERRTTAGGPSAGTHDRFAADLVNLLGDDIDLEGRRPAGAAAGADRGAARPPTWRRCGCGSSPTPCTPSRSTRA